MGDAVEAAVLASLAAGAPVQRKDVVAGALERCPGARREDVMRAIAILTRAKRVECALGNDALWLPRRCSAGEPFVSSPSSLGPPPSAPVTSQKQLRELLAPPRRKTLLPEWSMDQRGESASAPAAATLAGSAEATSEDASAGSSGTSKGTGKDSPESEPLSAEQQRCLDLIAQGRSLFFTGPAGTGKSFLLRRVVDAEAPKRRVIVTAPTGMAACIIGGTTINSWAGIGLGKEDSETLIQMVAANKYSTQRWRQVSLLVIDEISMLDATLFEKLECIGRALRNSTAPFGGIQLCLCGDFFQLPPVVTGAVQQVARFCFQSPTWSKTVDDTVVLTRVFRQKNETLARLLNEVREGVVSQEFETLLKSLAPKPPPLLAALGYHSSGAVEVQPTRLFARNIDADRVNAECLRVLPGARTYKAQDWCVADRYRSVLEACPAPSEVRLAVGAQVVLLKNMKDDSGLVNGSRGVVVGFSSMMPSLVENNFLSNEFHARLDVTEVLPLVKFAGYSRPRLIVRSEWEILEGKQKVASRVAVPLKLAWALSIHKSQGMTIDRLCVDLSGVFEFGQAYVALSRCSSIEGLSVAGYRQGVIFAHPAVTAFYSRLAATAPMSASSQHLQGASAPAKREDGQAPFLTTKKRPKPSQQ